MEHNDARFSALEPWINALNSPEKRLEHVAQALSEEVQILRFGVYEEADQHVETFVGHTQVVAWLDRTPSDAGIWFKTDGAVTSNTIDGQSMFHCPYAIGFDTFVNRGYWLFTLADDGRIQSMEHHPNELDEESQSYTPSASKKFALIGNVIHSVEHHDHDHHEHDHPHD